MNRTRFAGAARWLLRVLLAGVLAMIAVPSLADTPEQRAAQVDAAWAAARKTATVGPAKIKLLDQAELALPAGQAFIPAAEANQIMVALGNKELDGRQGLIVPAGDTKANWLIDVDWAPEGYVKDGDAKEWEPDALLDSLKEGTEKDNERRKTDGIPGLDIIGWIEKPTYDPATHQLLWSVAAREQGAAQGSIEIVNYNTYALGREGFFSLDLITGSDAIASDKAAVHAVLANLAFTDGKRYADYNSSTDKVAEYGLAGLIGAVAIKKLGLLAILGAFLLKAWKVALFVILGGWAAFKKKIASLFGRNKPEPWPDAQSEPDAAAEPAEPPAPEAPAAEATAPEPDPRP